MNRQELDTEINAIRDLTQRLSDRIDMLSRRLHRHFDLPPGGGKTDTRLTMTRRGDDSFYRRWDDDGGD